MKRMILAVAMLTAFVFTMSAQNNYSRLWAKVRQAEKEGKPQTAATYLRELEEKTIKAGDELEQLAVSENLYEDLRKYNWKEANAYYSTYASLSRRLMVDSLEESIVKYADHPRIMTLLQKRLRNHKDQLDSRWTRKATGEEYLAVRKEAEALLRHKYVGSWKESIQSLIDAMDSQSLSAGHHDVTAPGIPAGYTIGTRNVKQVEVKVYRLLDDRIFREGYKNSTEETLNRNATLVSTKTVGPLASEYNIREESRVSVDFDVPGIYVVRMAAVPSREKGGCIWYDVVNVSNVVGAMRTRNGGSEVYAADFRTGKPFSEGKVKLYKNLFKNANSAILKLDSYASDTFEGEGFRPVDLGKALTDRENEYLVRISSGSDIYAPLLGVMRDDDFRHGNYEYMHEQAVLFTDRALYKPSDTIHFKLICYEAGQTSGKVIPDKRVKVKLRHISEREPVATVEVKTNRMGSAAGVFTLPDGAKNGNYVIEAEYLNSRIVRVEEYKRPNFTVSLEPVGEPLGYGDVVRQAGQMRSFAGYSVAGGEVWYQIHRTTYDRTYGRYLGREDLMDGVVISDADGRFEIVFPAERPRYEKEDALLSTTYDITVRATDPQGETHDTSISVPVADIPVELGVELPDNTHFENRLIVDKDNVKSVLVTGATLNGTPYACPVTWTVLGAERQALREGQGTANEPVAFDFGALPSGDYTVKARTEYRGREITAERKVVVMSTDDKKLPFQSTYFYYPIRTEGAVEFVLGTTEDDLYLELELFDNDNRLYREGVHLQNEMRKFVFPYKSEWRSAVKMSVFGIRNGEEIDHAYEFTRPGDVRLDVAVETFRDKTTPGSTEKMTLRAPAGSELLVSIYDVTTDRYRANSFGFHPLQEYVSVWRPRIQSTLAPYRFFGMKDRLMMKGAVNEAGAPMVLEEAMVDRGAALNDDSGSEEETPEFQGRTNFSELVAFYPQIEADPSGRTEVSYTVSDLLTTYKVLVMAHDERLFTGDASAEFIVQQELMVQPNVPLFATEGDRLVLKSKIVNLSSREIKGTAYIELSDASGKKLRMKGLESQKRWMLAGTQEEVSWTITVPGGTDKLTAKIWFVTPTATDGEQHEILIVPNTVTLTEAASFVLGQGKTHKYYEKQLRKKFGADNPIIEYAEYSTLDAVKESLPKAEKPISDNAINWTNQLYINQMRNYVLKDDPADYESFRNQAFSRLKVLQSGDGGIQWFPGMRSNGLLTLYFLEKIGQLRKIGALEPTDEEMGLVKRALSYVDAGIAGIDNRKDFNAFGLIRNFAVRSLWFDVPMSAGAQKIYKKFIDETGDGWQDISILEKAQLSNLMLRAKGTQYDDKRFEGRIKLLRGSLKDYAVENPTVGCYFPNAVMPYRGLMNSEIYAHAQLMETFGALGEKKVVDGIAQWLLLQKHNQAWETTVATTDAVYALVSSKAKDLKLGAVYYTYTTKLERVIASANELSVQRTFVRTATGRPLEEGELLRVGDEITVSYAIHNTENRSFVQMRAMRPASFYPRDERSYYTWYGYYREVKPSETNFYWELLPEEYTTVQETFFVTQEGTFNSGLVEIECLYAKEYRGHTDAVSLTSGKK